MIANANSIVQHVTQIKNRIAKHANMNLKISNSSTCICENTTYFKIISDASKIVWNEIISVTDTVSAEITNTIATSITKNCSSKKVTNYYILVSL